MRLIPVSDRASDFADYYQEDFNKRMAVELAAESSTHPAFAVKKSTKVVLDLSAQPHGMPAASSRDLTAEAQRAASGRRTEAPMGAPLSPTNELAMIDGLETRVLNSSPSFGGFSSAAAAGRAVAGESGDASTTDVSVTPSANNPSIVAADAVIGTSLPPPSPVSQSSARLLAI